MVIKEYETPSGNVRSKMTKCVMCGDTIRKYQGFADHWSSTCPENPKRKS